MHIKGMWWSLTARHRKPRVFSAELSLTTIGNSGVDHISGSSRQKLPPPLHQQKDEWCNTLASSGFSISCCFPTNFINQPDWLKGTGSPKCFYSCGDFKSSFLSCMLNSNLHSPFFQHCAIYQRMRLHHVTLLQEAYFFPNLIAWIVLLNPPSWLHTFFRLHISLGGVFRKFSLVYFVFQR